MPELDLQTQYQRAELFFIGGLTVALILLNLLKETSGLISNLVNISMYLGMTILLIIGGITWRKAEKKRKEILKK